MAVISNLISRSLNPIGATHRSNDYYLVLVLILARINFIILVDPLINYLR
jgi:hypothetical protein